jgi:hypothetical protein
MTEIYIPTVLEIHGWFLLQAVRESPRPLAQLLVDPTIFGAAWLVEALHQASASTFTQWHLLWDP